MSQSRLVSVFRIFPKELFRVNNGYSIRLRPWSPHRRVYDIVTSDKESFVEPKALDPPTYKAPNGASMRPNSIYQQTLVLERFRGNNVIVFAVPKGTKLPNDLLLVHERSDHYSLQPGARMTIEKLNQRITQFLVANAKVYHRQEWADAYPEATE